MNKLALLIPVFLSLALLEWLLTRRTRSNLFSKQNTAMNICIGAIDQVLSLAHFWLFYEVLGYVYEHFRIWTPETTWLHWVTAYITVDFVSYWYHRFSHRIALFWCGHITHHSSEYFNLTNGFRTSPFQGLNRILLWGFLPVFGFSPQVLFVTFIISGLYDFFLHTENFPKLRWLELVFITPSLHKVHHGKNDVYIDKNYGSTFVIWDKMFGTFQDETEKVVYGILSKEYKDDDPLKAIFYHYVYLWKAMQKTRSWKNRIKLLIMPPDWLPEDIQGTAEKEIEAADTDENSLLYYGVFQFVVSAAGILGILVYRDLLHPAVFLLNAFLFLTGMITGTRIFHRSEGVRFRRNELLRNLLIAAVFTGLTPFIGSQHGFILIGLAVSLFSFLYIVLSANEPQSEETEQESIPADEKWPPAAME